MKSYARVEKSVVLEVIAPAVDDQGNEIPIDDRFTAEFVSTLVDITGLKPQPDQHWIYEGMVFSPAPVYVPSPEEIKTSNISTRNYYLESAALAIAPLQYAVDLDDATVEENALLKKWKQYSVAVNRTDLALESPAWPTAPT